MIPERTNKWKLAQQHERKFWEKESARILSPQWISVKKERAEDIFNWVSQFMKVEDTSKILQIGAGGDGVINFFPRGLRYAIDPLADFFIFKFKQILDPHVDYKQAKAEEMPFPNDLFDFIIIHNVLDHCEDINKALNEIHRCLKQSGVVYIGVHIYKKTGLFFKTRFFDDPSHPHILTGKQLYKMVSMHKFKIIDDKNETMVPLSRGLLSQRFYKKLIYPIYWLVMGKGMVNILCSKG